MVAAATAPPDHDPLLMLADAVEYVDGNASIYRGGRTRDTWCTSCGARDTPIWRKGRPLGVDCVENLCNACGIR